MTQPEPWPIANAIAALEDVRNREGGSSDREAAVRASMEYAIAVVRSINTLKEPQPPDPAEEARRAVQEFCQQLGIAFDGLAQAFYGIAAGEIPERR